jgi:hypothetical protein
MSWPWVALLVAAVAVVVAAEWPRLQGTFGLDARKRRERSRRKASLQVIVNDDVDEFEASVRRDLESLPTTEEPGTRRR